MSAEGEHHEAVPQSDTGAVSHWGRLQATQAAVYCLPLWSTSRDWLDYLLFGGDSIIFRLFAFRGLTDQKGRIYTTQH